MTVRQTGRHITYKDVRTHLIRFGLNPYQCTCLAFAVAQANTMADGVTGARSSSATKPLGRQMNTRDNYRWPSGVALIKRMNSDTHAFLVCL